VLYGAGGTAIGLVVGWVISRVRRWIGDPRIEITVTLFTPYAAYMHRLLSRSIRERNPSPPWQQVAAIAYTGMRGPSLWRRRWPFPSPYKTACRSQDGPPPALRRPRQRGRRLRRTLPSVPAFQAGVARRRACVAPPAQGRRLHQRRGKTTRRVGPRPRRSAAGDLTAARMTPAYRAWVAEQVAERQPDRLRRTASTNVC
jgi:hypothetical protein